MIPESIANNWLMNTNEPQKTWVCISFATRKTASAISQPPGTSARLNRHRMNLETKSESVRSLQEDWLAFGAQAFEFDTLDKLEPLEDSGYDPTDDLEVLESLWLEKLQPYDEQGYNSRKV